MRHGLFLLVWLLLLISGASLVQANFQMISWGYGEYYNIAIGQNFLYGNATFNGSIPSPGVKLNYSINITAVSNSTTFESIYVNYSYVGNFSGTYWYIDGILDGTDALVSHTYVGLHFGTEYNISFYARWNDTVYDYWSGLIRTANLSCELVSPSIIKVYNFSVTGSGFKINLTLNESGNATVWISDSPYFLYSQRSSNPLYRTNFIKNYSGYSNTFYYWKVNGSDICGNKYTSNVYQVHTKDIVKSEYIAIILLIPIIFALIFLIGVFSMNAEHAVLKTIAIPLGFVAIIASLQFAINFISLVNPEMLKLIDVIGENIRIVGISLLLLLSYIAIDFIRNVFISIHDNNEKRKQY